MWRGNAFDSICLSVCLCVCPVRALTWPRNFIFGRYIFRISMSSSYIKVIGSRSRSQEQKVKRAYLKLDRLVIASVVDSIKKVMSSAYTRSWNRVFPTSLPPGLTAICRRIQSMAIQNRDQGQGHRIKVKVTRAKVHSRVVRLRFKGNLVFYYFSRLIQKRQPTTTCISIC